ncbi:hypothetical protein D1816_19855 [Aquimarina sp. AD10]|uniref:Transporter n=1 Tax=Aquimarina aggregata TaxID=1642818 RepID=A0A162DIU0_9FLAO|nr:MULTISPECIES: hypothetical protein [Aquimarina]AXT63721.1 hypothetical protein D1816_19855 [Aquimarina sp. AD10]KZS41048.1 hypothetical protein AWE51_24025 [Aquimarina aggregata]RKM90664.1 hypothetical protein D7033_22555 [Aquimarina sp. AD10]
MKTTKNIIATLLLLLTVTFGFAQDGDGDVSNIQEFTPSKLLKKGQWDIKVFTGVYTQTKRTDARSNSVDILRETFLTNTNEIYTGISKNSRVNIGLIFQIRSNQVGGDNYYDALGVFRFKNDKNSTRSGLTTIAPSIRVQPFKNIANFSFTSSFFIPLFEDTSTLNGLTDGNGDPAFTPYLDQRSFAWETRFFFDHTFGGNKWQVFTELDFRFNFGEDAADADPLTENLNERFANESLFLPSTVFLSYFPSSKSTVFVNAQQSFLLDLGNGFAQNSTQLGFGGKYQLTRVLNIEASYGKIVRGNNFQGLGNTTSIGLRAIF